MGVNVLTGGFGRLGVGAGVNVPGPEIDGVVPGLEETAGAGVNVPGCGEGDGFADVGDGVKTAGRGWPGAGVVELPGLGAIVPGTGVGRGLLGVAGGVNVPGVGTPGRGVTPGVGVNVLGDDGVGWPGVGVGVNEPGPEMGDGVVPARELCVGEPTQR